MLEIFAFLVREGSMSTVDRETINQLVSMINSSYELSFLITLTFASTPPGEFSPDQMDALTDICYKMLNIQDKMKEILADHDGLSESRSNQAN